MSKLYQKHPPGRTKKIIRFFGLFMAVCGFFLVAYFSFPLISFQLYLEPAFASQGVATPIPKATVLTESTIKSLLKTTANSLQRVNYMDAKNWFPAYQEGKTKAAVTQYFISIPKISITNAVVTTVDNDLSRHLVNYGGTAIPPEKGNSVIYGHSTLPQLFNHNDYKTIFARLHLLEPGDEIKVTVDNLQYSYMVTNILITSPSDTTIFTQSYDDSYLTLVTCTPPGTTWKRLIVKAKITKVQQ